MKKYIIWATFALLFLSTAFARSVARADQQEDRGRDHAFRISSTTFTNAGTLPLSMAEGPTLCGLVADGGNQSPQLSWENPPRGTRSFVVTMFDPTAAFTHWGMYNISRETKELPENAGVAGSTFGQQVFNDYFVGERYDGPCPPNNITPLNHEYLITVYALDDDINPVSTPPNFGGGPTAETLYRAMFGHILGSASIHGFFSSASN